MVSKETAAVMMAVIAVMRGNAGVVGEGCGVVYIHRHCHALSNLVIVYCYKYQ